MSASAAAARPKATILVTGRVGARGGRIRDFDDDSALHAVIAAITDIQVALAVDDNAGVGEELARVAAGEHAAVAGAHARWVLVDGPPNAETTIELLAHRDGLGHYRLVPTTGRTHQLRLHMSGLGIPILGDGCYPVLGQAALDDFRRPLQLLARTLRFTDPITGEYRWFESRRTLAAWTSYAQWSG